MIANQPGFLINGIYWTNVISFHHMHVVYKPCKFNVLFYSVIFVNNFAFGPEVDHQLKERFANMKEGW